MRLTLAGRATKILGMYFMSKKQNTVCLIDDDEQVRTALTRLLQSADLDVDAFASVEEFLSRSMQLEAACILVDIAPRYLEAPDLWRKLSPYSHKIPIIVISVSDESSFREHACQMGAVSFFRKPIDDQALLDAIMWATTVRNKARNDNSP